MAGADLPYSLALPLIRGDFPSGMGIGAADGRAVQVTVKNRWPDGSAKLAIIAGRVTLAAGSSQTIELITRPSESVAVSLSEQDLLASGFDASISFGSRGAISLRPLIGRAAARSASGRWQGGRVRTVAQGPLMSSWTYMAMLGSDAHLAAWFEVRYFGGSDVQLLAWLENGFLKTPGCKGHIDRLSLSIQGNTVFSEDVHLANHCRVVAQDGAGVGYLRGTTNPIDIHYPGIYLQATGLLPAYLAEVDPTGGYAKGLTRSYSPAKFGLVPVRQPGVNYNGNFSPAMGSTGYHGSIGLVPEWDAVFVASGGHADCAHSVFAHGLGSGRYSLHDRDETTLQPLIFGNYANLVVSTDNRGIANSGGSSTGEYTPAAVAAVNSQGQTLGPETWASSHHPSLGYTAYLLSGFQFFLEASQFAATLNYLKQPDVTRQRSSGVFLTNAGANTTRGAAWALRTLAQAACITPDGDSLAESFRGSLIANLDYYYQTNIQNPGCPFGICAPYTNYTQGMTPQRFSHATWMEDFLTAAWGWVLHMGLIVHSAQVARFNEFFAWKARSIIGRLGNPGASTEYGYHAAAQYTMVVAPSDSSWINGAGPWYANWGQAYVATNGKSNSDNIARNLEGAYYPDPTSYWGNLMPAISQAVEAGVVGAVEAYARMTLAPNWGEFVQSSASASVWAIRPRNPAGVYSRS